MKDEKNFEKRVKKGLEIVKKEAMKRKDCGWWNNQYRIGRGIEDGLGLFR